MVKKYKKTLKTGKVRVEYISINSVVCNVVSKKSLKNMKKPSKTGKVRVNYCINYSIFDDFYSKSEIKSQNIKRERSYRSIFSPKEREDGGNINKNLNFLC
jgi:hypothetical protein